MKQIEKCCYPERWGWHKVNKDLYVKDKWNLKYSVFCSSESMSGETEYRWELIDTECGDSRYVSKLLDDYNLDNMNRVICEELSEPEITDSCENNYIKTGCDPVCHGWDKINDKSYKKEVWDLSGRVHTKEKWSLRLIDDAWRLYDNHSLECKFISTLLSDDDLCAIDEIICNEIKDCTETQNLARYFTDAQLDAHVGCEIGKAKAGIREEYKKEIISCINEKRKFYKGFSGPCYSEVKDKNYANFVKIMENLHI